MASIVIAGDTSGTCTLLAQSAAGNTVLTLPTTSGTLLASGSSPSFATLTVTGDANFATSSGNVGIGTSSPSSKLEVSGSNRFYATSAGENTLRIGNSRANDYVWVQGFGSPQASDGYTIAGYQAYSSLVSTTSVGILQWAKEGNSTDNKAFFSINNHNGTSLSEAFRITSGGNVGIGTSIPNNKLTIASTLASGIDAAITCWAGGNTSSNELYIGQQTSTNLGYFYNRANAAVVFGTNNTERMRIASTGQLLISNTVSSVAGKVIFDASADSPNGADQRNSMKINMYNGNSNHVIGMEGGGMYLTTDAQIRFYYKAGATSTAILVSEINGNFTISGGTATKSTGTTWANPSDIRLKENITNFDKGLSELQQVNVKTWEYNGKGGTVAGTKGLGVIADEIAQVLPDTVDTYKAKLNVDDEEETDIKRFDATEITWLLVNAVKELNAKVEAQAAEIAALKGAN